MNDDIEQNRGYGFAMLKNELDKMIALAENWEKIAERLDNQPVVMTANSHRLFANELRATLSRIPRETRWDRFKSLFRR